jgi:hypothetical protein
MSLAYGAPWSLRVKALTALGTIVLLGDAGMLLFMARFVPGTRAFLSVVAFGLLAVLGCCALLTVRGYGFDSGTLLVQRLVWTTRVSLEGLRSVVQDPTAIGLLSIKAFGNGGLFAILGWRRVRPYGWCRVFATDPARAVVLECKSIHIIVTPDRPAEFVQEARQWTRREP